MKRMLKVTIVKSQPSMWYNSEIGSTQLVSDTKDIYYRLVGHNNKIVFKCDANELVS